MVERRSRSSRVRGRITSSPRIRYYAIVDATRDLAKGLTNAEKQQVRSRGYIPVNVELVTELPAMPAGKVIFDFRSSGTPTDDEAK